MNTYMKLRNGSWGLRVAGVPASGELVEVTKRNGEVKTERVGKVLWIGDELSICTIGPDVSTPDCDWPTMPEHSARYGDW